MKIAGNLPLRIAIVAALVAPLGWTMAAEADEAPWTGGCVRWGAEDSNQLASRPWTLQGQRLTRFECEKANSAETVLDPTLSVLGDREFELLSHSQAAPSTISRIATVAADPPKPPSEFGTVRAGLDILLSPTRAPLRSGSPYRANPVGGALLIAVIAVCVCAWLRIWEPLDKVLFHAVVAMARAGRRGRGASSGSRRRRHSASGRAGSASWYFRALHNGSTRRRRRRWGHAREFVVADVVYATATATAPAASPARRLLTCNN